jgi:hypothetical protein
MAQSKTTSCILKFQNKKRRENSWSLRTQDKLESNVRTLVQEVFRYGTQITAQGQSAGRAGQLIQSDVL